MINDIEKIYNNVKTTKLPEADNYVFEIDLENENITKSSKIFSDDENLNILGEKLPPSFIYFTEHFANGLDINIGNALTIYPVNEDFSEYWNKILALDKVLIDGDLFPSNDFVFFGGDGGGELYAFYTAIKYSNGEFPIVWFSPGSVDRNPFVLLNSSFDKFLTIQYYLLKATEYEETGILNDEILNSSAYRNELKQDEINWQKFHDKLYDTFEPTFLKPNYNYFNSAMTLNQLKEAVEYTKSNSHQHGV